MLSFDRAVMQPFGTHGGTPQDNRTAPLGACGGPGYEEPRGYETRTNPVSAADQETDGIS